ncbi:hypothetical protein CPB83DRAFT_107733 [Crepidotus variabilis]|uniref:DUF6697 domain-containing protein n=1 Tax=Crepidotus variabilis TaxID=179855 RepID=A0A9P6JS26_9AGAR|nr:hypothetical protein CPB83DRAFT_107733 [Crepidotus variabilis]
MGFVPLSFKSKGVGRNRNFLFPGAESNPDLPTGPGEPGLLLGDRPELAKLTWSLLLPISGKTVRYNYFGEYLVVLAGYLSAGDFARLDSTVKDAWANRLMTAVRHKPYKRLRAQLILRKKFNGEAYTEKQVQAEMKCIKKGYTGGLTTQYACQALEQGLEYIKVYKLQCVSYSHHLAREYQEAAKTGFDPATRSSLPSKRKQSDGSSDKEDLRVAATQKKRKTTSAVVTTTRSVSKGKQRESPGEIDEDSDLNEIDVVFAISSAPSTPQSSARRSQRSRKPTEKLRGRR